MAEQVVLVQYIARGASQVGAQALKVASAHQAAAAKMAKAGEMVAARSRQIAGVAAFAGKAVLFGLGAALAVSAKAAIDFEESMAGVFKTLGDSATNAEILALGDALRAMSLDIPLNIKELAQIAELGGQLGVGIEDMEDFTETVAAIGVSTNLSAEDAAKGLARFSNIMELPIKDVAKLGNIIVDLGNNFATTESEILTFALRLAPIGKTVGATEEQIFGLATAFSSLGIPAERGATALQRSFLDIERAVDSGGPKLIKYSQAAGMTVEQFTELDAVGRFTAFTEGLRTIQDEGGSALTTLRNLGINQQRTIQVLLAAAGAGGLLAESLARSNQAADEGNALWIEASRRYGTTISQIKLVANAFNDLRIELGSGLIPIIKTFLSFLKEFFVILKNNAGAIKALGVALAVIVGIKGLLGLTLMAVKGVAAFQAMRVAMSAASLTTGGLISGLSGATVAMAGLTGAIGLAVVAFTVFTVWQANAQRKAADLQAKVDSLNESLDKGINPAQAYGEVLNNTLTPRAIDGLLNAGVSIDELSRSLAKMPGARPLSEIIEIFGEAGRSGVVGTLKDIGEVMGGNALSDTFNSLSNDVRGNAGSWQEWVEIVGSDAAVKAVGDRQKAADDLARILQFEVAVGLDAEQKMKEAELNGSKAREDLVRQKLAELDTIRAEALDDGRTISFLDTIYGGSDENVKAWEDFVKLSGEALDTYSENVLEAFQETKEGISSGIGAWDEYAGAVDISLADAQASMDLRLVDAAAWNQTIRTLLASGADPTTITFFEAYGLAEKAALTGMLKDNPKEFFDYVDSFEEGVLKLNDIALDNLDIRDIFSDEMNRTVLTIAEGSLALEEKGIDAFAGFTEASMIELEKLGPLARDSFFESILVMANSGIFTDMFGIGQNVVDAMIQGLLSKQTELNGAMGSLGTGIRQRTEADLLISSPSKVFMDIGRNVSKGLALGIDSGLDKDFRGFNNFIGSFRQSAFGPGQGSVTNNSNVTNRYDLSVSGSRDPGSDGQSVLLAAQLAGVN